MRSHKIIFSIITERERMLLASLAHLIIVQICLPYSRARCQLGERARPSCRAKTQDTGTRKFLHSALKALWLQKEIIHFWLVFDCFILTIYRNHLNFAEINHNCVKITSQSQNCTECLFLNWPICRLWDLINSKIKIMLI